MDVVNVGINLSKAFDSWSAFAQILKAEPFLERLQSDFPGKPLHLHYYTPDCAPLPDVTKFFGPGGTVAAFIPHGTPESLDGAIAFEYTFMADSGLLNKPYRHSPAFGKQNWFTTEVRPLELVFVFSDLMGDIVLNPESFPKVDQFKVTRLGTEGDMTETFLKMSSADMVVTDHCGVALIAAALSVNRITCLEMMGDRALLEGIPEIHRFRRAQGSAIEPYQDLMEYVAREWSDYKRYPDLLNQGDAQRFIQPLALQYCKGAGLDVGSNHWPFPGALSSDINNRQFDKAPFDFIFSSHCLEHISDWQAELTLWRDSLRSGGIMFCYVPHPLCEVWLPEGPWVKGGWHVHSPDPLGLYGFVRELGMEVLNYSSRPDQYWGFHLVARKK